MQSEAGATFNSGFLFVGGHGGWGQREREFADGPDHHPT